jgi:exodeoxyribonuclease VII large subunit
LTSYSKNPNIKEEDSSFLSVSQVNKNLGDLVQEHFHFVKVIGEISSINFHASGHVYLTLKDSLAVINAVIFKSSFKDHYEQFKVGDTLLTWGSLALYHKQGKYSLQIYHALVAGQGNLYKEFLDLQEELEKQGLFNKDHKKSLPFYIKHLAIITSSTGAAVGDFLRIAQQFGTPFHEISIIPSLMQGKTAIKDILESLEIIEKWDSLDAVLITRGGGEYEELAIFNNRDLAYKVYGYSKPVISAIGHERDFTILDFVADYRFSTPSHAAEELCFHQNQVLSKLEMNLISLNQSIDSTINRYSHKVSLAAPFNLLKLITQQYQYLKQHLNLKYERFQELFKTQFQQVTDRVQTSYALLQALNPKNILQKGFSFVQKSDQSPLSSVFNTSINNELQVILKDGKLKVKVLEINKDE